MSTSFGSTTDLSILIDSTSWRPLATTVTMPPPEAASTVLFPASACSFFTCSCICWACFIKLLSKFFDIVIGPTATARSSGRQPGVIYSAAGRNPVSGGEKEYYDKKYRGYLQEKTGGL